MSYLRTVYALIHHKHMAVYVGQTKDIDKRMIDHNWAAEYGKTSKQLIRSVDQREWLVLNQQRMCKRHFSLHITKRDVRQIERLLLASSMSMKEIGDSFGVGYTTVVAINAGYHRLQKNKKKKTTYPIRTRSEFMKKRKAQGMK